MLHHSCDMKCSHYIWSSGVFCWENVANTTVFRKFAKGILNQPDTHPHLKKNDVPQKERWQKFQMKTPAKRRVRILYIYICKCVYVYIYICMHSFRIIINFVQACGIIYDNSGYSMIFLERRCGPVRFEKNNNNLPSRSLTANAPEKLPKPNRKGSSSSPTIFQG